METAFSPMSRRISIAAALLRAIGVVFVSVRHTDDKPRQPATDDIALEMVQLDHQLDKLERDIGALRAHRCTHRTPTKIAVQPMFE
jgi:hypothetical protein